MIWRALGIFWAVMLVGAGAGAGVLEYLGAPPSHPVAVASHEAVAPTVKGSEAAAAHPAAPPTPAASHGTAPPAAATEPVKPAPAEPAHTKTAAAAPPLPAPETHPPAALPAPHAPETLKDAPPAVRQGAIAPPDPALLEPSSQYAGGQLPRIGPDRRKAQQAYAARFNTADPRPRIAVLVAGIGMNEADSNAAISTLPAVVSLAISPYAPHPGPLLDAARSRGHEFLVSIPMEPQGYPLNDPGNQALLTGASQATNALRLEWALTRMSGYVGATGALGEMRGERFAAAPDQMAPLLDTLADRGLLYVDPRPDLLRSAGSPTQRGASRGVDVVIDDPPGAADIDRRLERLEQIARDRGAALGLAGRPSPITIDRIAAWAVGLNARGLALAPVSVVVQMPQAPAPTVRVNLLR